MVRTYRYRLYPNKGQRDALGELLWVGRCLYNKALAYRRKRWSESRYSVTYYEQAAMWREWRDEDPEDNPLRVLNMTAGQQVLRRLDSAYREFLKGERGKPRFKRGDKFNSVSFKPGDGVGIRGEKLYVQNVGLIRVRWHRDLPEEGEVKNVVILRKPSGWYALFQVELPDPEPEPHPGPEAGVDVGTHHPLALSDNQVFDSPRCLEKSLKKLRVLQRTIARRKKGSNRWWKAVHQMRKLHEHIANQRRDWWHKVTRWLVDNYSFIALENLSLEFMLQNPNLARAAHDVGLGTFTELLTYKAVEAGCELKPVNPYNTSQMCSCCGEIVPKDLSVRVHNCPHCGLIIDRDVNAAINILNRALCDHGVRKSARMGRSGVNVAH